MRKIELAAFLCKDDSVRSRTSVCLAITDDWFAAKSDEDRQAFVKGMPAAGRRTGRLRYRLLPRCPAGIRIWAGATVETSDMKALCLGSTAYESAMGEEQKKAA